MNNLTKAQQEHAQVKAALLRYRRVFFRAREISQTKFTRIQQINILSDALDISRYEALNYLKQVEEHA